MSGTLDEFCVHCKAFEHLHVNGECPTILTPAEANAEKPRPGQPGHAGLKNLLPGDFKRKRGRPTGSKARPLAQRIEEANADMTKSALRMELRRELKKQQDAAIDEAGKSIVQQVSRVPRNPLPLPPRDIAQCKEAAMLVINQQLWDFEGIAKERSLTEDEVTLVLKLLAGFNAALPKQAEKRTKPIEDMDEDELRAELNKK
jgi:hypothetical protein